jgi:hypothetical protein
MAKSFPADAGKTNIDQGTDDPKQARSELADLVDKFNTTKGVLAPLAAMVVGDGLTVTDEGAGNADTLSVTPAPSATLPRGHLTGLKLSNNTTDATNDIDIAEGQCRSEDNVEDIILASTLTKRLDASWVVGTNQGGLDTGAVSSTGTYHVHAILRSDTGVVDALFSLSPTAPTLPASYDYSRRIGSFMRQSGVNVPFVQDGDLFQRAPVYQSNTTSTTAVSRTLGVPTGLNVLARFRANGGFSTVDDGALFTDLAMADVAPSAAAAPGISTPFNTRGWGDFEVRTNTSAQIRERSTEAATVEIVTYAWIDRRGRDD